MDKRSFMGMVEAGEPLIQQAIDAMREYHKAQNFGASPEEGKRLRIGAPPGVSAPNCVWRKMHLLNVVLLARSTCLLIRASLLRSLRLENLREHWD
ncbi:hypothetical protein [Pseudomonas urmiensis]|uniref:hypothetical protein n=1 Tax=Pseudomonas urmiensis TaxID=2745493 RepID=UPI003CBA7AF0